MRRHAHVDFQLFSQKSSGIPVTCLAANFNSLLSIFRYHLVALVVALRVEDPGFESRLRQDFSGPSHTSDLKIDTPVATLPVLVLVGLVSR